MKQKYFYDEVDFGGLIDQYKFTKVTKIVYERMRPYIDEWEKLINSEERLTLINQGTALKNDMYTNFYENNGWTVKQDLTEYNKEVLKGLKLSVEMYRNEIKKLHKKMEAGPLKKIYKNILRAYYNKERLTGFENKWYRELISYIWYQIEYYEDEHNIERNVVFSNV